MSWPAPTAVPLCRNQSGILSQILDCHLVAPCQKSHLHTLHYSAVRWFKDDRKEQVPIDKLADYVTKLTPESEINAESIKEALVYYPVPYCQNNIEVIC